MIASVEETATAVEETVQFNRTISGPYYDIPALTKRKKELEDELGRKNEELDKCKTELDIAQECKSVQVMYSALL